MRGWPQWRYPVLASPGSHVRAREVGVRAGCMCFLGTRQVWQQLLVLLLAVLAVQHVCACSACLKAVWPRWHVCLAASLSGKVGSLSLSLCLVCGVWLPLACVCGACCQGCVCVCGSVAAPACMHLPLCGCCPVPVFPHSHLQGQAAPSTEQGFRFSGTHHFPRFAGGGGGVAEGASFWRAPVCERHESAQSSSCSSCCRCCSCCRRH